MRILIANRGEIARRILRTAHRLGHETVAAWADPDRDAPFVREATVATRLGPAALSKSYLSVEAWLDAAARTKATAVHPGYGFLSENANFASAVVRAGLVWVGPHAGAIESMGSKVNARSLAVSAGVPTIPGFDESQDLDHLARAAEKIGFPLLVKASAGGGGKGIRIVSKPSALASAIEASQSEAERSFGDATVLIERYIERARHIEVQVVGDKHGNVVDLGTRECSIQRRYQKVLEEAPAPNLPAATVDGLRSSARSLAESMHYDSTGTVEFVVDDATGEHFFLEMNTRLQVEHPVTEEITGLDLVELQLLVAEGRPLPIAQRDVVFRGHAFEARINAEDPARGFLPRVGRVTALNVPDDARWESGVEAGSEITPHYDSMIAKLITRGDDRDQARRRMRSALDELILVGLTTNAGFQRWLVETQPVVDGRVTTRFLDENDYAPDEPAVDPAALAATAWSAAREARRTADPWSALASFRITPHRPTTSFALADAKGEVHERPALDGRLGNERELVVEVDGVTHRVPVLVDVAARSVSLNLLGTTHDFRVLTRSEHWAAGEAGGESGDGAAIRAPFPGVVTEVSASVGDSVKAGDTIVVLEAMKMLHTLSARGAGVVAAVHVAVGESVEGGQTLVSFEAAGGE